MATHAETITAEMLLNAYANGYFPMAETRASREIFWFCPETRGILPLEDFHIPRSLAKTLKRHPFDFTVNRAFEAVIRACAEPRPKHPESWINAEIVALYMELHRLGFAHSLECWRGGELAGGIYGIALGGAFFGESMFSRVPNASKAALSELAGRLRKAGYVLFDTQYVNPHLSQFGCIGIPKTIYLKRLKKALSLRPQAVFS